MAIGSRAADETLLVPGNRLEVAASPWRDLRQAFAQQSDITADFEERRFFPFRKRPVVLRGEVRVSPSLGLSLHYVSPETRTVIFDERGMLVREPAGQTAPPIDPRANLANDALRHILRLDFEALGAKFELFGRRNGEEWQLGLVPRAADVRRAIGDIFVAGHGRTVRAIELRRSPKQHIDIAITAPREPRAFSADERRRFFR